jgi:hypothetical protein
MQSDWAWVQEKLLNKGDPIDHPEATEQALYIRPFFS